MESLSKLKDMEEMYKKVIFSHDFTNEGRKECKKLVEEAKKKEQDEGLGEYIYRVRGMPGNLKILKIRKRNY
jgi:hypothetical protein